MSLVVGLMCVITGTLLGVAAGKRYAARERLFLDLQLFCRRLSGEIRFSRPVLSDALGRCKDDYGGCLNFYIGEYIKLLERGAEVAPEILREKFAGRILKESEFETLVQLFAALGTSDAYSQEQSLEAFRDAFALFHEPAREEKKKYGALYSKLGFFGGLIITILIL